MNVRSLAASIVAAHNEKSFAEAIDASDIHRLELLRLPYVHVDSCLRIRIRFEAGVVDEEAYAVAHGRHATQCATWQLAMAAWRESESRRTVLAVEGGGIPRPHDSSSAGAPPPPARPREPKRFDFAEFCTHDRDTVTEPMTLVGRLFDPQRVFPGWSASKLQARENEFLLDSPEPFAGLAVVDPREACLDAEAVLRQLARTAAEEVAQALAAESGHEFCRKVRVLEASWLSPPSPTCRYLMRASICRGRRTLTTELALRGGPADRDLEIRLDEHLTNRGQVWKATAATVAAAGVLLGGLALTLAPSNTASGPGLPTSVARP